APSNTPPVINGRSSLKGMQRTGTYGIENARPNCIYMSSFAQRVRQVVRGLSSLLCLWISFSVPGTAQSGDAGTWTQSGPFNDVRAGAVAVRLLNGKVLLAGGAVKPFDPYSPTTGTASAEIFDPRTGQWTSTGSMNFARAGAAATLLPDGRVLVAGGGNDTSFLQSIEIYDPITENWSMAGSMTSNYPGQAILLTDGRVLLLHPADVDANPGGIFNGKVPGELYDPVRGTFQLMTPLKSLGGRLGTLLA